MKCGENFELTANSKCLCKTGFYLDENTKQCVECDSDCATCNQAGVCETCPDGFVKGKTRCLKCESDEFVKEDTCTACSTINTGCISC